MQQPLNVINANYKLRRYSVVPTSTEWTLICPPNPSRWHLQIISAGDGLCVISPFPSAPLATGLTLTAGVGTISLTFKDSPVLCGAAWYCSVVFPTPGNLIEAWETTLAGT